MGSHAKRSGRSGSATTAPTQSVGTESPHHAQRKGAAQAPISSAASLAAAGDAVQMRGGDGSTTGVKEAAARGTAGAGSAMPFASTIQAAFGHHDIGGIRAHTGGDAREAAASMGAQAYATGDAVAFAGAPDLFTAAHEAAHYVQQQHGLAPAGGVGRPGDRFERQADEVAAAVVKGQSAEGLLDAMLQGISGGGAGAAVQMRESLGSSSWDHPFTGGRVTMSVFTQTEAEWRDTLSNLDDESELMAVRGFLLLAVDPSYADRTEHPLDFANFSNDITRAPNPQEVLAFMKALYSSGNQLDLPNHLGEAHGGSVHVQSFRTRVATLITQYQDRVLLSMSEQGEVLEEDNIAAMVKQGDDPRIVASMVCNGVATATKGLDLLASAPAGQEGQAARTTAHSLIRNAGRTVRYTLEAHNAQLAARADMMNAVFLSVWAAVPGGGTIGKIAKEALKQMATRAIKNMAKQGGADGQAAELAREFEEGANAMLRSQEWATETENALQTGINSFLATWR